MRISGLVLAAVLGLAATAPTSATAAEVVIDATGRGWMNANGQANGASLANNYLAGNCGALSCTDAGEYRNFFTFAIPLLDSDLLGAVLRLNSRNVDLDQAATFTYQVTSTGSMSFAGLGTGQLFGARVYAPSDFFEIRDIVLNSDALAAIGAVGGGVLTISGRVLPPTQFGQNFPNEYAFGDSGFGSARLILTTGTAVPEPTTWALMILGLGGVGALLRRQRMAVIAA